jgi:methylated-DNA-[protein]-cysteine S-methyltransferase
MAGNERTANGKPVMDRLFTLFDTTFGTTAICWTARGIVRFYLPGDLSPEGMIGELTTEYGARRGEAPSWVLETIALIREHLAGRPQDLKNVPVDLERFTPFQRRVLVTLQKVGIGELLSYSQLACRAGAPGTARAVGSTMARNPVPLIIPCHRVIKAGGALGHFSSTGGAKTKARLLALEEVEIDQDGDRVTDTSLVARV